MKKIASIILISFIICFQVQAESDSVAIFHRPNQVIVQINEANVDSGRLFSLLDFLGALNYLEVYSSDKNIKIKCGRNDEAASCIFNFTLGKNVEIINKKINIDIALSDLNLSANGAFKLYFESSMHDKFNLYIANGRLIISARKKSN